MLRMAKVQILAVLLACLWATSQAQLNRLKIPSHRTGGTSKFSLNPLKPLMKLMRQDPMKAAAQRHHAKYLPPPPGMYQQMALPSRASPSPYGMYPYRPYPSQYSRLLPPSTMSFMPSYSAAPSTVMLSALVNDQPHQHYRPMSSDVQFKAVRIPSKSRRPNVDTLNIADSVVRQLLDNYQQQQQSESNQPSVLVIEDPDVASSSGQSEMFGDSSPSQKVVMSPPLHAELSSDSSADVSSNSASNPEVFVIVSKNKSKNNSYYIDDKKSDVITTSSSSSPKLKKYKITSSYDENGSKQVWIIK